MEYPKPKTSSIFNPVDFITVEDDDKNDECCDITTTTSEPFNDSHLVRKSGDTMQGTLTIPQLQFSQNDNAIQKKAFTDTINDEHTNNTNTLTPMTNNTNDITFSKKGITMVDDGVNFLNMSNNTGDLVFDTPNGITTYTNAVKCNAGLKYGDNTEQLTAFTDTINDEHIENTNTLSAISNNTSDISFDKKGFKMSDEGVNFFEYWKL